MQKNQRAMTRDFFIGATIDFEVPTANSEIRKTFLHNFFFVFALEAIESQLESSKSFE